MKRWFFTNPHPLIEALKGHVEIIYRLGAYQYEQLEWLKAGVEEFGSVEEAFSAGVVAEDGDLTGDYNLRSILREMRPDVCVLTPVLQPGWGFHKGHVNMWSNGVRGRVSVGLAEDPGAWEAEKARQIRGCAMRRGNLGVYVTNDTLTARKVSAESRAVLLEPPYRNVKPLLDAVDHAATGKMYSTGRMGKVWV